MNWPCIRNANSIMEKMRFRHQACSQHVFLSLGALIITKRDLAQKAGHFGCGMLWAPICTRWIQVNHFFGGLCRFLFFGRSNKQCGRCVLMDLWMEEETLPCLLCLVVSSCWFTLQLAMMVPVSMKNRMGGSSLFATISSLKIKFQSCFLWRFFLDHGNGIPDLLYPAFFSPFTWERNSTA